MALTRVSGLWLRLGPPFQFEMHRDLQGGQTWLAVRVQRCQLMSYPGAFCTAALLGSDAAEAARNFWAFLQEQEVHAVKLGSGESPSKSSLLQ